MLRPRCPAIPASLAAVAPLLAAVAAAIELPPPEELEVVEILSPAGSTADADGAFQLRIDDAAYDELWVRPSARVLAFPLPDGRRIDLVLAAFEVAAPGARYVVVDGEKESRYAPPAMRTYRGRVSGNPDSLAYLWLSDRRLGGFLMMRDPFDGERRTYLFGPRSARLSDPEGLEHVVQAAEATSDIPGKSYCGAEMLRSIEGARAAAASGLDLVTTTALLRATLAIDTTYEYYARFGSVPSATSYANALVGAISTIYENEVLCQQAISYFRLFTTDTDPYDPTTGMIDMLGAMIEEWTSDPQLAAVPRTVTHLFSSHGQTETVGGVAYVDAMCSPSAGYGASNLHGVYTYPNGGYTWDADVLAHELGHNYGSYHTHCYVPPVDCCTTEECDCGAHTDVVGTIMSYCHIPWYGQGKNLVFSPQERAVIRPTIERADACVQAAGRPGGLAGAPSSALMVRKAPACPTASLVTDDGTSDTWFWFMGAPMVWAKRLAPACYPFRLTRMDVQFRPAPPPLPTVQVGRPLRLLLYVDASGSGDPANAVLVHEQDVTVQVVSATAFNEYQLTVPVTLTSGHLYLGVFDLLPAPPGENEIAIPLDTSTSGDSYESYPDYPDPSRLWARPNSWMIRGRGGAVSAGALELTWGAPCNDAGVPDQDYAVYRGTIGGGFASHASQLCTTHELESAVLDAAPGSHYFVVVPQNAPNEGHYGGSVPPAASPCRPQLAESCPP